MGGWALVVRAYNSSHENVQITLYCGKKGTRGCAPARVGGSHYQGGGIIGEKNPDQLRHKCHEYLFIMESFHNDKHVFGPGKLFFLSRLSAGTSGLKAGAGEGQIEK